MTGTLGRTTSAPKILFVHNQLTRFVQIDRDLLRERFQLVEAHVQRRGTALVGACRAVSRCDLVFGWFASWHTLLPLWWARRLGKPSLLVIGGYDLACLPEIGYGHQRPGLRRWVSRAVLGLADSLVTNAHFSAGEAARNAQLPAGRVRVIYHGLPDPLGALPAERRSANALTVGNVDRPNLQRKGLAPFVGAARHLPGVDFTLVGAWRDDAIADLRRAASRNVTFTGWVEAATLWQHYQRASVYVQASLHEGFGLSVAEAMLAGCIPVVTRAGALPEVVAECGFYAAAPTPAAIAAAISCALHSPPSARQQARDRVLTEFSLGRRQAGLYAAIDELVAQKDPRHGNLYAHN